MNVMEVILKTYYKYNISAITRKIIFPDTHINIYIYIPCFIMRNSCLEFTRSFDLHPIQFQALMNLLILEEFLSALCFGNFILVENIPDIVVQNIFEIMSYLEQALSLKMVEKKINCGIDSNFGRQARKQSLHQLSQTGSLRIYPSSTFQQELPIFNSVVYGSNWRKCTYRVQKRASI